LRWVDAVSSGSYAPTIADHVIAAGVLLFGRTDLASARVARHS
jgi:hypothetical protein